MFRSSPGAGYRAARFRGSRFRNLVPDLTVEVLSEGNTAEEMERKLKEYFLAGVRLVWFVDPEKRVVEQFTAPDESRILTENDLLTGGEVLPGFLLPVRDIFQRVPARRRPGRGASDSRKQTAKAPQEMNRGRLRLGRWTLAPRTICSVPSQQNGRIS